MYKLFTALLAVCITSTASAQQAIPCDWIATASAIVEPWEENTRQFSEGKVRLALLDLNAPAAGSVHFLILSPPYIETGERQCMTLGMTETIGFSEADFSGLEASYDPSVGLIFDVDVEYYDGNDFQPGHLQFTLNQATGAIGASLD